MVTRAELRRQTESNVLDAADQLFRTVGYRDAKIRDIAEVAGVSVGTVMSVGDKRTLLVRGFDRIIAREHDAQARARAHAEAHAPRAGVDDSGTVLDQVMGILLPFSMIFAAHPDLGREYIAVLLSAEHESVLFTDLSALLHDDIARVLEAGGHSDPSVGARAVSFAYVGALLVHAGLDNDDVTAFAEQLRDAVALICAAAHEESNKGAPHGPA